MKIAVMAEGPNRNSAVDPHFARALYFVLVDIENNDFTVRGNANVQQTQYLAGTQAAGLLISLGVEAVITTNIGPRAFETLKSAKVRVFRTTPASAEEAVELFKTGQLAELSNANVEEHRPQHGKA